MLKKKKPTLVVQKLFQWEVHDPNWILEHSLSFHELLKIMPKFKSLIKGKLIRNILVTVAICD